MAAQTHPDTLPAADLPLSQAPGHWVLARLGKRVLRPGGRSATRRLLESLAITREDRVVEFAPGMGATARLILQQGPGQYLGIDQDEAVVQRLRRRLADGCARFLCSPVEASGLPAQCCDVVVGEAMLTMQPDDRKRAIVGEAARLLSARGRYGIHEIVLDPPDLPEEVKREIRSVMTQTIHHGVMPLTGPDWVRLLEAGGFELLHAERRPFHLLEPGRLLSDEGLWGAARFGFNLLRMPEARRRVLAMRSVFARYRRHLKAILMIARKV